MKFKSNKSGFTLIELLVAMALFLAVVTVASGSFIQSLRIQRNLVALMAANDSASLTLEQIAREMRTSSAFGTKNGSDIASDVFFTNAEGVSAAYELLDGGIVRSYYNKDNKKITNKITADNVQVNYLKFVLFPFPCPQPTGLLSSLNCPQRVTISLGVVPKEYNVRNFSINLQTTVSARLFQSTPIE